MMNASVVPYPPGNEKDLAIETEIANELPVLEADQELRQVDVAAGSRDLQVQSTLIATFLVLRAAEAVVGKARPSEAQRASETEVAAETGTEIETKIEMLVVLGTRKSLVVGVGLEAGAVGEIEIGRRPGAGVVVLTQDGRGTPGEIGAEAEVVIETGREDAIGVEAGTGIARGRGAGVGGAGVSLGVNEHIPQAVYYYDIAGLLVRVSMTSAMTMNATNEKASLCLMHT